MTSRIVALLPSLPPKSERGTQKNPFKLIRSLTWLQLAFFFSGWFAWVCDAVDFFAVTLSSARLAPYFQRSLGQVTLAITLTLLFRPLGAFIFGMLCDRYGRKWPLVGNLLIISALSLGTGFCRTFNAFLACRSLFGIGMGGIWGLAVSMSLENMPVEARGLFSGFLQLGYPVGYLIIAAVNLNHHVATKTGWRPLFWTGAALSLTAALVRLSLPESQYFLERQRARAAEGDRTTSGKKSTQFIKETGKMLKVHWARCIFAIVLMTGLNFYSHASQDLYPAYLTNDKGLSSYHSTVATIIGNVGCILGCMTGGYASQYIGRRITMICACLFCCCMLPLWLLPSSFGGLAAGAFFVQFGVQAAYGVVPVYLSEISPVAFRAMWPGVAYQIGNMVSSASAQIEATAGARLKDEKTGKPAYGRVSAILIGVAAGVVILCCLFGEEAHSAHFEKGRAAFEKDAGLDVVEDDTKVKAYAESTHEDEKPDMVHHQRGTV